MERMTYFENGHWKMKIEGVTYYDWDFVDRMAAYENTGLTPEEVETQKIWSQTVCKALDPCKTGTVNLERLRELAEADREGRVVVLPCKVGDVVYGLHGRQTILPMVAKWIETNTCGWTIAAQYVPMAPKFYLFSDFGKTVFLTREEAEKTLEAKQNG